MRIPTARNSAASRRRACGRGRIAALATALVLCAGAAGAQAPQPQPEESDSREIPMDIAVLQGLDKVTARISTFEAPVGNVAHFGTLEIVPHACIERPPVEPPESAAFLVIRDVKPGEAPSELFMGWMFASSPALSALEHPVYDVWVVDCKKAANSSGASSE